MLQNVNPSSRRIPCFILWLEMCLAIVLAYQLWTKAFPFEVYLLAAGALAMLVGLALWLYQRSRLFVFGQVLLVSLLIMSVYYLATHYSVLPWGDPYNQYWVFATSAEQGQVPLAAQLDRPYAVPEFYSGWPAIHILGMTVAETPDLSPLAVAMFLPWVLFLVLFLFAYLLLKGVVDDLGAHEGLIGLGLLILVTSPFLGAGGLPPAYEYQYMAAALITMVFYLSHKRLGKSSPATSLVYLLAVLGLVITHHYTSFVAVLYLAFLAATFVVVQVFRAFSNRSSHTESNQPVSPFVILAALSAVIVFLWWDEVSTSIWPRIGGFLNRVAEIMRQGAAEPSVWETLYPYPSPPWAVALLWTRNILMFGGAALGLILIVRQRWPAGRTQAFIVGSLLALSIPALPDAAFGFAGPPYRAVGIFMPFLALAAAFFYLRLGPWLGKLKGGFGAIVPIVLALFVFSALVGQWAHQYVPRHLYDPSVSLAEGGEHPPEWRRLDQFLDASVSYDEVETFVTDESFVMGLILPVDQWPKIAVVGTRKADVSSQSLVVAFRGLETASYIIQESRPAFLLPDFDSSRFQREVERGLNRIYDDGEFQTWRSVETRSW